MQYAGRSVQQIDNLKLCYPFYLRGITAVILSLKYMILWAKISMHSDHEH